MIKFKYIIMYKLPIKVNPKPNKKKKNLTIFPPIKYYYNKLKKELTIDNFKFYVYIYNW